MGHHHHHHPTPSKNQYTHAFAIGVLLNLGFVIVEASYAYTANSMSLLADAGHNLGDVAGLALAWLAAWLLTRKAGDRYSYGHRKFSVLAAFANAVLLIVTSVLIARESAIKLFYPEAINETIVIVVALIGIFINGFTALLFFRGKDSDLNVKAAFYHLAADTLISAGVVFTGLLIQLTGYEWLDPMVGLIIVAVIVYGTWGLLRDSYHLIVDAVPHNVDFNAVRQDLLAVAGVDTVHDMHVWAISTQENALTAHLVMPDTLLSDDELHQIQTDICKHHPIHHVTLQIEKGNSQQPCCRAISCD